MRTVTGTTIRQSSSQFRPRRDGARLPFGAGGGAGGHSLDERDALPRPYGSMPILSVERSIPSPSRGAARSGGTPHVEGRTLEAGE